MKVFVTGATGFVGRNVVEYLVSLDADLNIRCLARDPAKAEYMHTLGVQVVHGDLLKPDTYRKEASEAAVILHIGALVGLKNGPEFYTVNREGTACLLDAIGGGENLARLVFLSSIAAVDRDWHHDWSKPFGNPLNEQSPVVPGTDYGKSKRAAEELIIESGLPYSILRPAYIYGPHPRVNSSMDKVVFHVRDQAPYTRFPFPGVASEIYAVDLAEALWHVAEHPGALNEAFFVANPEPVGVTSFFRGLAERMGVPYEPLNVSDETLHRFMRYQFHLNPKDPVVRILYTDYFHCCPKKLERKTGYTPRIGMDAGLTQTIDWYRAEGRL